MLVGRRLREAGGRVDPGSGCQQRSDNRNGEPHTWHFDVDDLRVTLFECVQRRTLKYHLWERELRARLFRERVPCG